MTDLEKLYRELIRNVGKGFHCDNFASDYDNLTIDAYSYDLIVDMAFNSNDFDCYEVALDELSKM